MRSYRMMLLALIVAGCAASRSLTPEERAYLERVERFPTVFMVSKENQGEAWTRALDFLRQFSGLRVIISTDYTIETERPTSGPRGMGYRLRKNELGDSIRVVIETALPPEDYTSPLEVTQARLVIPRNARILAYYMKTGELRRNLVEQ